MYPTLIPTSGYGNEGRGGERVSEDVAEFDDTFLCRFSPDLEMVSWGVRVGDESVRTLLTPFAVIVPQVWRRW